MIAGLGIGGGGGAAANARAGSGVGRSPLWRSPAGLKQFALSKVGVGVLAAATAGGAGYVSGRDHERAVQSERGASKARVAAPHAVAPAASVAAAGSSVVAGVAGDGAPALATVPTDSVLDSRPPAPSDATSRGPVRDAAAVDRVSRPLVAPAPRLDARAVVPPHGGVAPSAAVQSTAAGRSISEQLASIRLARSCVQNGDGRGAVDALDSYAAQNPDGKFEEEEIALRVRALHLLGDVAGAARARDQLQARFPGSVHLSTLE